jgi:hypothetical protein
MERIDTSKLNYMYQYLMKVEMLKHVAKLQRIEHLCIDCVDGNHKKNSEA